MSSHVDQIFHDHRGGKLQTGLRRPLETAADLSIAYTPGVAKVCQAIAEDASLAATYTWTSHLVAVVTDGSAVLGLGNIGPKAAMPVMEGKAALFKRFGGLDAVPICLGTTDPDEIVAAVTAIAPSFGGINLEDISAPRCFDIERRLDEALDIPVFHDDQHGTAIVVLAALRNALELTGQDIEDLKIVIVGAGAAGIAVAKMLHSAGARGLIVCDSKGIIHPGRADLTPIKTEIAGMTNLDEVSGDVGVALTDANVLIGVSGARVDEDAVARMAPEAIVFALANPTPEIDPDVAAKYARVVATGRSDMPNQINNVLAFPGIFRGALDAGAESITEAMALAAADAIADCVGDKLTEDFIVPSPLDPQVSLAVARAVRHAAETAAGSAADTSVTG